MAGGGWRSRRALGALAGILLGALGAAGIFFVPIEPRPVPIFIAGTIKGGLTGLLLAGTFSGRESWMRTLAAGAVLGGLMGLVVALAKGFAAAPYVVHASLIEGLLLAAVLKAWGRAESQ